jgi:GTP-binding protein LepA
MEIVQERLDREFDMDVITTVPNVQFKAYTNKGEMIEVHNPSGMPEPNHLDYIEEPYIIAQIITKSEYLGNIMTLCIEKRGVMKNQVYLTSDRVKLLLKCL